MTDLLVKLFVKDWKETNRISVRTAYGILSSIVGILCNVLLFVVKFIIGMVLNSISVTADAFNNLSDAGSSIISFIGVRMAGKPADEDHPFGHGRIEYICALVVAFLVIQVGFSFFTDSIKKIMNPEELNFKLVSIAILGLSICVKLWLGAFNRRLGKRINSQVMLATAADALGDVFTTTATIVSLLVFHFLGINVDGIVGVVVAAVVLWAGIGIAKDTLAPLIGSPADPGLAKKISVLVESYPGIMGSNDLIIHNYGPGRSMASIHAEVPKDADIQEIHETIDRIEREVGHELGLLLVIHMDPIETRDEHILAVRSQLDSVLREVNPELSMHDFRMVDGRQQINLIFDLVVPYQCSQSEQEELRQTITDKISVLDKRYQCVITIEKSFVATK